MNACRSVRGPAGLAIPAPRATRRTIRPVRCGFSRRPSAALGGQEDWSVAALAGGQVARAVRGASGMVTTLLPVNRIVLQFGVNAAGAPGGPGAA
jgi:hypothetical protein